MFTVIIIPCYNEEKRLDSNAFISYMKDHPDTILYFVDDGSNDHTKVILQELIRNKNAGLLSLPVNAGKAEAVRQGLLQAYKDFPNAELLGFWDADLATPLEEIQRFQTFWKEDTLMLMGCRHLRLGCDIRRKAFRHYLGRIFATAAAWHLDLAVYDTQCGAKLLQRKLIPLIFQKKFATKWFFDVEILRRCIKEYGLEEIKTKVLEVPLLQWHDTGKSKVNLLRCMLDFVKLLTTKE